MNIKYNLWRVTTWILSLILNLLFVLALFKCFFPLIVWLQTNTIRSDVTRLYWKINNGVFLAGNLENDSFRRYPSKSSALIDQTKVNLTSMTHRGSDYPSYTQNLSCWTFTLCDTISGYANQSRSILSPWHLPSHCQTRPGKHNSDTTTELIYGALSILELVAYTSFHHNYISMAILLKTLQTVELMDSITSILVMIVWT